MKCYNRREAKSSAPVQDKTASIGRVASTNPRFSPENDNADRIADNLTGLVWAKCKDEHDWSMRQGEGKSGRGRCLYKLLE